jgi:CubicO group peptidase (beta-lactamase class C family)
MNPDFRLTAPSGRNVDMVDFAELDVIAEAYCQWGGQPGLAWGVVRDGELVHSGGCGERFLGGPAPDADTVFCISSMSKSFTAAGILLLRDEGLLTLDDPAEDYLPEMRGWPPVTPDSARVTLRHLLTMTSGLPADDPWGDRQQGLPLEDFSALLSGGISFALAPDTTFEYASLGYAILGRVIAAVSGVTYQEFLRQRLLSPLGLTHTGCETAEFAAGDLALGYQPAPDGWAELPMEPCGAWTPVGGVYSSVRDLARWVAGFLAVLPPGADAHPAGVYSVGTAHPLAAPSRRQMQMPQILADWSSAFPTGGYARSYGFGLFIDQDPALGRIVHHPGGYPGFGSYMRWHPATGTGVFAMANSTYATPYPLVVNLLEAAIRQTKTTTVTTVTALARRGEPWPETVAARDAVNRLLHDWDDAEADRLFTPNVALDVPYQRRRRAAELIRERIGAFGDDPDRPARFDSPAHCRWWLVGDRGAAQAQITLSPEKPPRIQSLSLAVPPASDSPLADALTRVVGWLNGGQPVPTSEGLDPALASRLVRSAAAWAGTFRPGSCRAGNGSSSVSVDLTGEHASFILSITIDPATSLLHQLDIIPA